MNEPIRYYVRTVFIFSIIILVLSSYQTYLYKLFDVYALPMLKIDENDWLLLSFKVLGAICSIYIIIKAVKGFRLSFFHTVAHLFALALYGYFRYQACTTNIYIFRPDNSTIGYIDIIFIVVAISLFAPIVAILINLVLRNIEKVYKWSLKYNHVKKINYWTYSLFKKTLERVKKIYNWMCSLFKKPKTQNNQESNDLIPDVPLEDPKDDRLGYADFSEKDIVVRINSIKKGSPYSIGIIAEWGVGKSTVINFIDHYLDEDKYITIRFNPRHSYNPSRIQEDFFSFLSSELKPYNSIFSSIFVDYMKGAGIIGKNNTIQVILNIYKVWNKEGESIRINHAIKKLSKRVVVIIEDLDRLLAEEIIEVFKIIDNNAISNNIIFISAYDKEHINKIFEDKYKHENSMFSDKFFNWEIHLPLVSHTKIIQYINTQIEFHLSKRSSYLSVVNKHKPILQSYIKTMRDAKRFLNTFIKSFIDKENDVAFEDYLLVSLIKYKYQSEHNKLFNKEYVLDSQNKYILIDELKKDEIHSHEVLDILFNKKKDSNFQSINNKNAFLGYFYHSSDRIAINKLRQLFDSELKDSQVQLNIWNHEGKIKQVLEYFNEINILTLAKSAAIYNYIDILLFILTEFNLDIREFIRPFFLKADSIDVCKKYDIQIHEFRTEFTRKLKGHPGKYPYSLIRELIINTIDEGEKNYLFTKAELQEIAKYHVENYIEHKANITENLEIELLYENIENIELPDRIIKLNKAVCDKIKNYITMRPDFYIQNFVRNGMSSSSKEWFMLACEPFWEQVFGSKEEFILFLNNQNLNKLVNIKLARNFWKIYESNSFKPIEFQNDGITYEEAIADDLQSIAENALKFEEYETTIEAIYKEKIATGEKINRLTKISKEIESIKLYTRKRGKVNETIKRYITALSASKIAQEIGERE